MADRTEPNTPLSARSRIPQDAHDAIKLRSTRIEALEAERDRLREQVDAYFNDPSQVVTDLRDELDLVAASRDRLAAENEKLREALVWVVRGHSANDALLAAGLDPFPILTRVPR